MEDIMAENLLKVEYLMFHESLFKHFIPIFFMKERFALNDLDFRHKTYNFVLKNTYSS